MARSTTPAGIGYKDKHDLNDKVFTPADSEFVAITVDSAVRGVHTELDRVKELAEAVLAMSGIGPTSPVDACWHRGASWKPGANGPCAHCAAIPMHAFPHWRIGCATS